MTSAETTRPARLAAEKCFLRQLCCHEFHEFDSPTDLLCGGKFSEWKVGFQPMAGARFYEVFTIKLTVDPRLPMTGMERAGANGQTRFELIPAFRVPRLNVRSWSGPAFWHGPKVASLGGEKRTFERWFR